MHKDINPDTGFWSSSVWSNFIDYTKNKHNINCELKEAMVIVYGELREWNACNDTGCNTISFKTEADLTYFLLRFS